MHFAAAAFLLLTEKSRLSGGFWPFPVDLYIKELHRRVAESPTLPKKRTVNKSFPSTIKYTTSLSDTSFTLLTHDVNKSWRHQWELKDNFYLPTYFKMVFVPHLSAFFDTLRVLLVKLKAFLWAPKKDFTPLCSKGVKFFFATATFFFATANFFLPTVVSTSSKNIVAVAQIVLIVPTFQWSRCFANKK